MVDIFFLDFETTGLNPYHDDPIEIAIKKMNTKNYYQTLIKPRINGIHYRYISPKIKSITNITDEMIESEGVDPSIATTNILKYIRENSKGDNIYIVSHNGTCFDFLILKKVLHCHFHL